MEKACILLVDDDEKTLSVLNSKLAKWGYESEHARSGEEALAVLAQKKIDLVISDLSMPQVDGLELLREVKKKHDTVPFIMLTGYGTIDTAVASLKEGATDFLQKPYEPESLLAAIQRSLAYFRLSRENRQLKGKLIERYGWRNIITRSKKMADAISMAKKVAESPGTIVALYGESGTGKDLLAKALHHESSRAGENFVHINCAGIPAALLESELFGYVKGAFTGADRDKEGKFDLAQKGTIFLDEIGDMPIELQAKLLMVLQERTYEKVGSNKKIKADFRVIVATHRSLQEEVGKERFRQDLFHRINTFPIFLPPLRERKEDVALLANHFLGHFAREYGKRAEGISEEAVRILENHDWPGNVRELKNCIERAVILNPGRRLEVGDLNIAQGGSTIPNKTGMALDVQSDGETLNLSLEMPLKECSLERVTDEILKAVLAQCGNNKSKAAQLLGVDRRMFYRCFNKVE